MKKFIKDNEQKIAIGVIVIVFFIVLYAFATEQVYVPTVNN